MTAAAATPRRWALVAAVLAVVLLAAAVGCDRKQADTERTQMDAIAEQIEATLGQRPDVASAEVIYQNSLTSAAQASVSITVKTGADFEPVIDDTLRLLWQSRLDPLHAIRIDIVDGEDMQRDDVRRVNALNDNEKNDLDAKYGKRPV